MKKRRLTVIVLLAICLLPAAPIVVWLAVPARNLDVVVLDNTVPDRSFREHRGLLWLLNHGKYRSRQHGSYRDDRDYYGFFPRDSGRYAIRALPSPLQADLIYVADAYGVYQKEWLGPNPRGERSPIVYGGMRPDELGKIEEAARGGTPLVVEFNTFASPTAPVTRERLYDLLRVEWSGWIGRYFNELGSNGEVPVWAVAAYERLHGQKWDFTGPGVVLADEGDRIVVLRPERDLSGGQCEILFHNDARERLRVESGIRYRYWFDIVRLREGARELAYFKLDLTGAGLAQLTALGIPAVFPAVVRHDEGMYWAYYFAGDFADTRSIPRYYEFYGHDRVKAWLTYDKPQLENQAFFWRVYAPMMRAILQDAYRHSQQAGRASP